MATNEYHSVQEAAHISKPEKQDWASHVLIPLAQNIAGGAAVAGLGAMGVAAWGANVDGVAGLWCAFGGAAVTCLITITRFFGDDIGLITAAYRAGQASRDAQIAALQLELRASHDAQAAAEATGTQTSIEQRRMEKIERARRDAIRILEVHFANDSTSRSAMAKRGMGQRDWERAQRLLVAAGMANDTGDVIAGSPKQAIRAIDGVLANLANKGKTYQPAWK